VNPYFCDGPTILNISGGRTSGLMLRRILDAHDGTLPPETFAVFANTGRERSETLTFLAMGRYDSLDRARPHEAIGQALPCGHSGDGIAQGRTV
jgi:hypothetical protein